MCKLVQLALCCNARYQYLLTAWHHYSASLMLHKGEQISYHSSSDICAKQDCKAGLQSRNWTGLTRADMQTTLTVQFRLQARLTGSFGLGVTYDALQVGFVCF